VQLCGAVARVLGQLEERARAEQVSITSDIAPTLYVASDPLALDVVVRNVLENALAAVRSAGGGSIALGAQAAGAEVQLSVTDTGVGFPPQHGARLFEKFTRLHAGAGGPYATGLGLFIVRRLMELAHGRVTAHSDGRGRGAQLLLTWPAAAQGAPLLSDAAVAQEPRT
jgi:signal transduction histidine kinase